jgi:hypothetical protein
MFKELVSFQQVFTVHLLKPKPQNLIPEKR